MSLFKDDVRVWISLHPEGKEVNLEAHLEQIKLCVELNNSDIDVYNGYLVALFSITIPVYATLWISKIPLYFIILTLIINLVLVYLLLSKIKVYKNSNEMLVEGYHAIQSKRAGSKILLLEGNRKKIFGVMKELQKKATKMSPALPPSDKEL